MSVSDERLFEQVRKVIAQVRRIPEEQVRPDALLGDELGAESLDFVDIEFRLESELGIEFHHGSVIEKLDEIAGPGRIEQGGALTELGAALLRRRMPEVDPARLQPGLPSNVAAVLTPMSWVRAAREILDARPAACPRCACTELSLARQSLLRCGGCAAEIPCPTGEGCIETWARRSSIEVAATPLAKAS